MAYYDKIKNGESISEISIDISEKVKVKSYNQFFSAFADNYIQKN
jgi:hypothetical protein